MARRRVGTRPAAAEPKRKAARRGRAAEGPTSSARGNWIDEVDRVARRPFLEGDYLPGSPRAERGRTRRRSGP